MIESLDVPTDFSDYSHYILYEGHDKADDKGIPVYQSMSTGMLFAEDATPLIYLEDHWHGDSCQRIHSVSVGACPITIQRLDAAKHGLDLLPLPHDLAQSIVVAWRIFTQFRAFLINLLHPLLQPLV